MSESRIDHLKTLRVANYDVAFATAFGTLVAGPFLVGFVQSLNGSALELNILSAVPSLLGILQLPGAIWGRGFKSYKKFVMPSAITWRAFYIPFAFLPLLPWPNEFRLAVIFLSVILASIGAMLTGSIYNDWLAEMVPADSRGYYFSRRSAIATITGAFIGIVGAFILDAFKKANLEAKGFSVVFSIGVVCAAISLSFFVRMRDVERKNPIKQGLKEGIANLANPFRDREYRQVLVFLGVTMFAQTFAGNLFAAFGLKTLNLDYKIIQGAGFMHALGTVVFFRLWGFVSDKYGNKPVLALTSIMLSLNPIPWMLCKPGNHTLDSIILLSSHPLMALGWSGWSLCQFNIMLATAKPAERASYMGAGMALSALVGGVSPITGALVFDQLRGGFSEEVAYKTVFGLSVVLRLIAAVYVLPIKEAGSRPIKDAFNDLRNVSPKGMKAMRTLAQSTDTTEIENAIDAVGNKRVNLASDAIIKALHDPQPRVRRRAADALAKLDDPRAIGELIHQIDEHPDLIEEETVRALGRIGDARAIPALQKSLESPRSIIRRASAHALGRILSAEGVSNPKATQSLIWYAGDPHDPDLRRAALQALRDSRITEAEPTIIQCLMDSSPSVRIAAAEAVAEMRLRAARPTLLQALQTYSDEASAEVAYALGSVGVKEDVKPILAEAQKSVSIITRRRCLLGVARLLDVEAESYRLMLLEGMARDQALMHLASGKSKSTFTLALNLFASNNESGALVKLQEVSQDKVLAVLSSAPVQESFLIAYSYAVKLVS